VAEIKPRLLVGLAIPVIHGQSRSSLEAEVWSLGIA
jgi:hypothetical protein